MVRFDPRRKTLREELADLDIGPVAQEAISELSVLERVSALSYVCPCLRALVCMHVHVCGVYVCVQSTAASVLRKKLYCASQWCKCAVPLSGEDVLCV